MSIVKKTTKKRWVDLNMMNIWMDDDDDDDDDDDYDYDYG